MSDTIDCKLLETSSNRLESLLVLLLFELVTRLEDREDSRAEACELL
jgi:hypothetical protein